MQRGVFFSCYLFVNFCESFKDEVILQFCVLFFLKKRKNACKYHQDSTLRHCEANIFVNVLKTGRHKICCCVEY